jgi:hypothetical protein
MFLQHLHKWQVRMLVAPFENILKIAGRLVRVNEQGKVKFWRHGDVSGLLNS